MSPFSGAVLGSAAVVSAPALWSSLVTGASPIADGLLRYVAAVLVCWLGLSVVAALVGPAPRPPAARPGAPSHTEHDQAA
jgi:threonine/homoserine/homoserine lactone efflux protein